ncbi:MAG: hypothetical protein HC841_00040 [Verrucomicrobiae bacterium]|nr:hypothetical protein [Verrucomicrobiae bacterium]
MAKTKKKKSTAPSLTWPQMHTRVSATNQKFLHGVKKASGKDVIFILDAVIGEARKRGVTKVAKMFATKKRASSAANVAEA